MEYSATFEGNPIDGDTPLPPVRYDPTARTFEIYSEDFDLIGERTATILGYLEEYAMVTTSSQESVIIEFIDPCIDPVSVSPGSLPSPLPYEYDGSLLEYDLRDYLVNPSVCIKDIEYTCTMLAGPVDLCSDPAATFDPLTGDFTFSSTDLDLHPPGTYTFEILGTVGSVTAAGTWRLTLQGPCERADAFEIISPIVFSDTTYFLRDSQVSLPWTIDQIVQENVLVDCGEFTVDFFQEASDLS